MLLNCAGKRLLRVPWTARGPNQSILKEIDPEYSLEGLMLKLQYFGHLMWKTDFLEKTLMLGRLKAEGEGDNRRWDGWMASLTRWTWVSAGCSGWWWTGKPGVLQSVSSQRVVHDWVTKLNWCQNRKSSELFLEDQKFVVFLDYFSRVVDNTKNMIIILFASRVRWRN